MGNAADGGTFFTGLVTVEELLDAVDFVLAAALAGGAADSTGATALRMGAEFPRGVAALLAFAGARTAGLLGRIMFCAPVEWRRSANGKIDVIIQRKID